MYESRRHGLTLPEKDISDRVANLAYRLGLRQLKERIGVGRIACLSVACGLPVVKGTLAIVRETIDQAEKDVGDDDAVAARGEVASAKRVPLERPPEEMISVVRDHVHELGPAEAAKLIGVGREGVLAIGCGLPVTRATIAVVRASMAPGGTIHAG